MKVIGLQPLIYPGIFCSAGINGIEAAYYLYNALRAVEEKWNSDEERKAYPLSKEFSHYKHPINFNLVRTSFNPFSIYQPSHCPASPREFLAFRE